MRHAHQLESAWKALIDKEQNTSGNLRERNFPSLELELRFLKFDCLILMYQSLECATGPASAAARGTNVYPQVA